ncbi:metal-binding protein, partial [Bordetella pertussis]
MSHVSTLRRALRGALLLAPAAALANTPIPIDVWRTPTC